MTGLRLVSALRAARALWRMVSSLVMGWRVVMPVTMPTKAPARAVTRLSMVVDTPKPLRTVGSSELMRVRIVISKLVPLHKRLNRAQVGCDGGERDSGACEGELTC